LLRELARFNAAAVFVSITTLDVELAATLEPRASLPQHRLAAIETLRAAGIPVGLMVAPVIPGLTDHEMPAIMAAAAQAGAATAGFVLLRLPFGLSDLFEDWLTRHFPERKEKVLNRIRCVRGGKLNDGNFGSRMRGDGVYAEQIHKMFDVASRRTGLNLGRVELSTDAFRVPAGAQLSLFG
jgi:DNA repair photolyase